MQFTFLWIKGADNYGNWKLCYQVCMYPVPKGLTGFGGKVAVDYVDTCPNTPQIGMAFCQNHCVVAAEQDIPTQLRESTTVTWQLGKVQALLHQFQTQPPMLLTVKVCYSLRIGLVVVRNNPSVQLNHISACM